MHLNFVGVPEIVRYQSDREVFCIGRIGESERDRRKPIPDRIHPQRVSARLKVGDFKLTSIRSHGSGLGFRDQHLHSPERLAADYVGDSTLNLGGTRGTSHQQEHYRNASPERRTQGPPERNVSSQNISFGSARCLLWDKKTPSRGVL